MPLKEYLNSLVEQILPGLARQRQRKREAEQQGQWYEEQKRKLAAVEEIEPPWIAFPNADALSLWVSWRYGNFWLDSIWRPFWQSMTEDQQRKYFEKWQPSGDWYENIVILWDKGLDVMGEWVKEQNRKLEVGEEIEPPWIAFPLSSPNYGWDGNYCESWKLQVWLPFWHKLGQAKQREYLEKWQPPSEEWREFVFVQWTSKLKKSERWYKKQLESEYCHGEVETPWQAFPNNPTVYEWDNDKREQWLKGVWLPFWNKMSEEEQTKYLEHKQPPDDKWLKTLANYEVNNLNKLKETTMPEFV